MNGTDIHIEKLVNDLKLVLRDADALLKATAGEVSDTARAAREKLTAALDSARASCQELEEKAVEQARATDQMVRDHPYESIGIAFGVGLLVGVLLGRR